MDTLKISGHADLSVADIVATADRWLILSAYWDTARVFNVRQGREVGALTLPFGNPLLRGVAKGITGVPDARIEAARLSSDGQFVILGCMGSTLKLWDLKNGQVRTLTDQPSLVRKIGLKVIGEPYLGWIKSVASTSNRQLVVSGCYEGFLKVWNLNSGQVVTLDGHSKHYRWGADWLKIRKDKILDISITSDRHQAVTACEDGTLKLWDLDNMKEIGTLEGHTEAVNGVALVPNKACAISASDDGTVKMWDLKRRQAIASFSGDGPFEGLAVAPNGLLCVAVGSGQVLPLALEGLK
ncbi:MAG TPA: hypothetical protein PKD12_08015 [Nitrospira sp.]|nr:hypothetical protein [Nitrospira sp.]